MTLLRNRDGRRAWNRVLSVGAAAIMSVAFLKEASTNALEWADYIGYSIGVLICYSPVVAAKLTVAVVALLQAVAAMKANLSATTTSTKTTAGGETNTETVTTPVGGDEQNEGL